MDGGWEVEENESSEDKERVTSIRAPAYPFRLLLLTPRPQVILLALPGTDTDAIAAEVSKQCAALPRAATAVQAVANSSILKVESKEHALAISNAYAPEHLIINTADAEEWVEGVECAGSIFLGR